MITDPIIKTAIKAGRARKIIDGEGKGNGRLVLHIRPAKGRVLAEWYAQQITVGKRRLRKIGTYPGTSLAEARRTFEEAFSATIAQGKNIKATRARKAGSVADLFDAYITFLKAERKGYKDVERILIRAAKSFGETRKANEITTEEVIDFLRPIYNRGRKSLADHARGYIRAAFSWAIKSQNDYRNANTDRTFELRLNPATSIPVEAKGKGDRWLEAAELREFLQWIDGYQPIKGKRAISERNLLCLKLATMLGQRTSEITSLHRSQYNAIRKCLEWQDTKTGRAHILPLPKQAVRILESTPPNEHGWFFPSALDETIHTRFGAMQAITRAYVLRNKKAQFCPRDFRRTFKTLAGFAGITKSDRDRLQNHAHGDISSRHYDRYDYLEEKRAAMAKWEQWFEANVENEPQQNVINIAV